MDTEDGNTPGTGKRRDTRRRRREGGCGESWREIPEAASKKSTFPPSPRAKGPVQSILRGAPVRIGKSEPGSLRQGRRETAKQGDHRFPSFVVAGVEFHRFIVDGNFFPPQVKLAYLNPPVSDRSEPSAVDHRETNIVNPRRLLEPGCRVASLQGLQCFTRGDPCHVQNAGVIAVGWITDVIHRNGFLVILNGKSASLLPLLAVVVGGWVSPGENLVEP